MIYEIIPPCDELKNWVSHFWTGTRDTVSGKPDTTYYVIAGSLTELVFAFNRAGMHSDLQFSAVQGHTHVPAQFSVDGFGHLLGVSLYSYAVPDLFHISASELNAEFISTDVFLGQEGAFLNEKMAAAATTQQRVQLLSDYFISRLKKRKREDALITGAVQEIRRCRGHVKINEWAREFCLSPKQFNRRFNAYTGFTPKLYSRILRFESVIRNYSNTARLTETAYASGYYDQAHFNHDFKSFSGFSPTDFRKMGEDQR